MRALVRMSFALVATLPFHPAVVAAAPSNSVVITETSGTAQTNRPFTISRVFAQAEISNYAQPRIGGVPAAAWQCDVMNRWPDSSLKHALVSFTASLSANGSVTVDFVNNTSPSSAGSPLTQQQMLDFNVGLWGADIEITNGTTLAASARTMLGAGAWRYWLKGPVVTQAIVEDRSAALAYDLGWDSYKPLHPIFVLTFYPGWAGVKVEAILENCWTTKLEDVSYSVAVKSAADLSTMQYSAATFTHYATGRWRKLFWDGVAPGNVKVDLNLPYMISTMALPNYDTSLQVTSTGVNAELTAWNSTDKGVNYGNNAEYVLYFPTTGGRGDIGYAPRWFVRYLFTFDPQLQAVFDGNAAVSGYVPVHIRESRNDTTKFCAISCTSGNATVPAFGRPLSIDARPTIWAWNWTYAWTTVQDQITPVGAATTGLWTVDQAHQADFAYIPYLLTGDWYFLEELYFWSSYNLSNSNAGVTQGYGRHNDWGILNYLSIQSRGWAWALRTLVHTVFMAPDGTPEQQYFTKKLQNNIAWAEGYYQITNGSYPPADPTCPGYDANTATDRWCWGKITSGGSLVDPLHLPTAENPAPFPAYIDSTLTKYATSPWMDNFIRLVWKRAVELGYTDGTAVQSFVAKSLIHYLVDPATNGYLMDAYRSPAQRTDGQWFQTWTDWINAWTLPYRTQTAFFDLTANADDFDHGYLQIARAAASTLPGIIDGILTGQSAWNWINDPAKGISTATGLNENPKWAIVPRIQAISLNPCDLNADGVVNTLDVQISKNAALGIIACTPTLDLNGDGLCNAVDTQRVINAALGGPCKVGP